MNLVVESNRDYSLIENHIIHFLRGSVRFFFFLVWVLVQVTAYNYTLLFNLEDIRKIVLSFSGFVVFLFDRIRIVSLFC